MRLVLNKETLRTLLAEECEEIVGGTGSGFRCARIALKGTPLGASSDLCCGSGSCPKPAAPPKPFQLQPGTFAKVPQWVPPKDFTKFCGQPQVKKG